MIYLKKLFFLLFCLCFSFTLLGCEFEKAPNEQPPVQTTDDPKEEIPNKPDDSKNDSSSTTEWNDYGFDVIELQKADYSISESGLYTSMEEVAIYIDTYEKLPSNYVKKGTFTKNNYTKENKLSVGGDIFYNREGLLPEASHRTYYECDIDYTGGSRNAKRIVFSSDNLIFYTADHYESFKIIRVIV